MSKKLCLLYGNCQVIYRLKEIIENVEEFIKIYEIVSYINHDNENISELKTISIEHLQNCDVFIYQPLGEHHGVYSTNYVKKFLKNDCVQISYPYIYNCAIYTVYFEPAITRWSIGTIVNCGWRHIIQLMFDNRSLEKILEHYDNNELDFYFNERIDICIEGLRTKEAECTIKVTDFILENFKEKRLFLTQNHLTRYFYKWLANKVFNILNINFQFNESYYISKIKDGSQNLISADDKILQTGNEEKSDFQKIEKKFIVIDSEIEAECVHDKYNQNHFNFTFPIPCYSDEATKSKIKKFYHFFNEIKHKYTHSDLIPYRITADPEKMNTPLGF
jgi:hypothetical protein